MNYEKEENSNVKKEKPVPDKQSLGDSIFLLSLFSIIFCCGIIGLILSIIALNQTKLYTAHYGEPEGRVRVGGKILAVIALVISILYLTVVSVALSVGIIIYLSPYAFLFAMILSLVGIGSSCILPIFII